MSKKEALNSQGNIYDKVFRENMLKILPGIIEQVLNLKVVTIEELKDDIHHTKERKTDLLKKVVNANGSQFILHVERYLQQLRILIKLRNLGQNLEEIMITISKYFKEENDPWFISGQKKGIQKGLKEGEHKQARETARKMLADNEPLEKIARYTELSIEEIRSL